MSDFGGTVDREDVERFAAQGGAWWDRRGSLRLLHQINPARLDFIRRHLVIHFGRDARSLSPFAGLRLADIGCGGGLAAEPMARLGFAVTGIDAGAEAIAAAKAHAEAGGLSIDYRVADIEALAATGERFDAVIALELIEHLADPTGLFAALGALVRPGGVFVGGTLNRTAISFATAVVGAEYLLNWLPRGTHDWRRFVRPSEFVLGLRRVGFRTTALSGLSYDWRSGDWAASSDLSVNYLLAAVRH